MRIAQALHTDHIESARALFVEYTRSVDAPACFGGIAEELARLPGEYAPPQGRLLLAFEDDQIAGCVALRPLSQDAAELKRLYVRPEWRGRQIARRLLHAAIDAARTIGYSRMLLDTLPKMLEARALYVATGFCSVGPYLENPTPGALCFELALRRGATPTGDSTARAPDPLE